MPLTPHGVTGGGSSVVVVATLLPSQYKTKLNNRHQTWLNLNLIPAGIQAELGNGVNTNTSVNYIASPATVRW